MRNREWNGRAMGVLLCGLLLIVLSNQPIAAQGDPQPRAVHNACAANCVADTNFLHSGMGDTQARNAYHGWFDSYFTLTGCDDPAWKTDLLFLLDIVGDAVGAPGAPTMQCWQGLAAQASLCSDTCSEYIITDARYAPNVALRLDAGGPGYHEVTLDNQSNLGKIPELQPNAYSRQFHLRTTLQRDDGEPLLVNDTPMPSLSFPNWITRGGLDDCSTAYGFESSRCQILANFATPGIVSTSVEFMDGVLYDLSAQVSDLSDANGSFSQDGYVRLLSDGDSITIAQGPYAGYVLEKTHWLSSGAHTMTLSAWDASTGPLTITNHECNSWLSSCWILGARHETDTFVYALQGPQDKILPGTYTVEVVADIPHEKDMLDNRASYAYDAAAVTSGDQDGGAGGQDQGTGGGTIRVTDLPVTVLDGPGIYPGVLPQDMPGALFRLAVPDEVSFMFVRLVSRDGGQYDAFVRRGSIPVPDFPIIADAYDCWMQADPGYSGGCPTGNPFPDDYYIFVHQWQGGGAYQLEIEWTLPAATATPPPTAQPTASPEPGTGEQDVQGDTVTEVEPNDSHATANEWPLQPPFTGQLARPSDRDVVLVQFVEPGIYTFSVTEVGPELRVKLTLVRTSTGNYLASSTASAKGSPVDLTLDASAGEAYYLIVSAAAMAPAANQAYRLSLSGFVPDPDEPNDSGPTATAWDLASGPVTGYYWDKITGRHDYFTFAAPATLDGGPVVFDLSNPAPDLRVRLTLLQGNGQFLANTPWQDAGQPVSLSRVLEAGQTYVLKVESQNDRVSLQPYTLSAGYTPAAGGGTGGAQGGRPVNLHGLVLQQGTPLPVPIQGAVIYAQVTGQPPAVLATSDALGSYQGTIVVAEGQQVRMWAEKAGFAFLPAEDMWSPDPRARGHRVIFVATGTVVIQSTPTPGADPTATPLPRPTSAPPATATPLPTPTSTPASSPTPPPPAVTTISGTVWRLFPDSGPAVVGAASVILAVNGAEQPAVLSMIDGSYQIEIAGLQPGDQLTLRAVGAEDSFEPVQYQWVAEAGVAHWTFDFFSYWGTIAPPATDDQNRVYGYVRDAQGNGVPGVTLLLQMGTSDALQLLGPTDASGYYEALVRLPNRVMVTVWVNAPGYLPSRVQFFHAYAFENREVSFSGAP